MKNIFSAALFAFLLTTLFACKKGEVAPAVTATFKISQPVLNQSYAPGDTIRVQGTITCSSKLHGYHLYILGENGDSLYHAHNHSHATELSVDEKWMNSRTSPEELKVIISCAINHEGGNAEKRIPINVQP